MGQLDVVESVPTLVASCLRHEQSSAAYS